MMKYFLKVKSLSRVWLFVTPYTVAYRAPQSMEFSSKSTGVGCHFLFQGIFPTQGSNLGLLHYRQNVLPLWATREDGKITYTVLVGKITPNYRWEQGHETCPFEYLSYSLAKRAEKSQKSKPRLWLFGNF